MDLRTRMASTVVAIKGFRMLPRVWRVRFALD